MSKIAYLKIADRALAMQKVESSSLFARSRNKKGHDLFMAFFISGSLAETWIRRSVCAKAHWASQMRAKATAREATQSLSWRRKLIVAKSLHPLQFWLNHLSQNIISIFTYFLIPPDSKTDTYFLHTQ